MRARRDWVRPAAYLLAVAVMSGCRATGTANEGGVLQNEDWPPAGALWVETFELRPDEALYADGRALEIQPIAIGVQEATLLVRVEGIDQIIELDTTGPLAVETIPPYSIHLVSTSGEPTASIEVAKLP